MREGYISHHVGLQKYHTGFKGVSSKGAAMRDFEHFQIAAPGGKGKAEKIKVRLNGRASSAVPPLLGACVRVVP